ncbi:spore germination protein [Alicyclobacillaceae bacterium I2511]|nr:spore germination protein [Alicyclobacillaceae bacterium I2511]
MLKKTSINEPIPAITTDLQQNVDYLNRLLGVGQGPGHSWDIMAKPFTYGGLQMMSYVLNGYFLTMNVVLVLDDVEKQIQTFLGTHQGRSYTMQELVDHLNTRVNFVQVQPVTTMQDAVRFILSGPLVTFIEGIDQALLIDTRIYPMRGISEPEVERVIRGPRDGFVETMLMNVALIRRRLRDPTMRTELMQIGNRSKTDVTLMYLEGVADPGLINEIRKKLQSIEVDAISMAEQSVTDLMGGVKWNPYPIVRFTERPDIASRALLEGQVVVVVDTTPEVIIAPVSLFQLMQSAEEYHSYPLVGTYMRWVVIASSLLSVFLPGLFLLINFHPGSVPKELSFFRADTSDPLPLWVQLVLAEIALDVLRLAVLNTPSTLASMVSIVSAIIFGQFATQAHLLQPEVLLYMAFVLVMQFAQPSYELATAHQMSRLWILGCTQLAYEIPLIPSWIGFLFACLAWFVFLATRRSFGVPYLWPLIPFRWQGGMSDILLRKPAAEQSTGPKISRSKAGNRG